MLYYEELFTRSTCLNCRSDVAGMGIECAECVSQGGPFRLCSDCFSVGAEIGSHKKEHRYRFFDSGSLSLFPGSSSRDISSSKENNSTPTQGRWSAREEIRLLDAIEQYGFGNWQDISKHIESRGATEAKDEFVQRYVFGNTGKVSWTERNQFGDGNYEFGRNLSIFPQPIDHTIPGDEGPLSPSLTQRLPPLDISADEMLQLGYMPFRDDYEKEYDNEAEKLVAQLNFTPDDDEVEIGLKLSLVDMYSRRLRERARRKRVIRDYQLVCKFFKKDRAKKAAGAIGEVDETNPGGGNKETVKRFKTSEKILQEKFQPYSQLLNCRELYNLAMNLVKEKDLCLRLDELFKYRSAGITEVDECVEYEKSLRSTPGGFVGRKRSATTAGLGTVEEEDDEDRSHKMMIQSPALIQQLLSQPLPTNQTQENEESVAGNACVDQSLTQQQSFKGDFNSKSLELSESELALSLHMEGVEEGVGMGPEVLEDQQGEDSSPPKGKLKGLEGRFIAENNKNKTYIPGDDLITKEELDICLKISLAPAQFIVFKLAFILGRLDKPPAINSNGIEDTGNNNNCNDENSYMCPPEMNSVEWSQLLRLFMLNKNSNSIK